MTTEERPSWLDRNKPKLAETIRRLEAALQRGQISPQMAVDIRVLIEEVEAEYYA